jgi:hypothetical protein
MLHKIITPFTLLPEVRSTRFVEKGGNIFTITFIMKIFSDGRGK